MEKELEIKFGKVNSPYYKKAIRLAKHFSDFVGMESDDDGSFVSVLRIDQKEMKEKAKDLRAICRIIGHWESTIVTFRGAPITAYDLTEPMTKVTSCFEAYGRSAVKEFHCNRKPRYPGWGCKFLQNVARHIGEGGQGVYAYDTEGEWYKTEGYWYKYGAFESEGVWRVDKEQIKRLLEIEAKQKKLEFCSIFSLDKVFHVVDELPDTINVNQTHNWEILYEEDFVGADIEKRATTISHKRKNKNQKQAVKRYIPNVTFDDIGGIDPIIHQIREVIELPLKRPDVYKHLGIRPHKGILLYGSPGNGKTLIAKAIANEVKAHFIPVAGPELLTCWYGESERNLRKIFEEARNFHPSVIFFDEIDSVAQDRSSDRLGASFVNQLLSLMDGMEAFEDVVVMASTNRPELIDAALLRPGRFDFKLEIKVPDAAGCLKILEIATRHMPLGKSVNMSSIAAKLCGRSGAEIQFTAKEAALNALRRGTEVGEMIADSTTTNFEGLTVEQQDFDLAERNLDKNQLEVK